MVSPTGALRYLSGRPLSEADEKGIDVQLAIDVMLMGVAVRWIGRKDYEAVRDPTDYNIAGAETRRVRS